MWMNGDSRSNLSAWLVWVSNFNSSLSSSKWFFFHCHIGMCFTFQNLLMLAWVREEKKEDFFMYICHVFFLQLCPLALLRLHAHCVSSSRFQGISDYAGKDPFPVRIWNSKASAQEQNISSLFFHGYYLFIFFELKNFIFFLASTLQS